MAFVISDGVRLHYEASGTGAPIVFAHESAADARQWAGQVATLSPRYRCITYNARGYPPSDVPPGDAAYGHEPAWRDLAAIVEQVAGGPTHIVGLSMGAYAGLMLGLERPDLVRSLCLAGGGTGSTRGQNEALRIAMERLATLYEAEGSEAGALAIAASPTRTGFKARDMAGWQAWFDDLCTHSPQGMARTFRNYQGNRPSLYAFEDALRRLDRPTLLVVGDEDGGCLEVNLFLRQIIAGAGLCVVPHSGHAVNLEQPAFFNRLLADFVAAAEGARALDSAGRSP
ncbi:MAG: hypothetical protein BGP16_01665 [Sphingobium sp. 66-54]|nr:MAG: hypothetical protein BGP16_01665 [Sphingobium sp. 66-54]